jgi:TP901-1 family phage major tail protein
MAASTDVINGSAYIIEISTDSGTTWTGLAHAQEASVSRGMATRETTSKSSGGWRELGSGKRQWTFSGSGLTVFSSSDITPDALQDILDNRQKIDVRFTTANTGDFQESGEAYLTQLDSEAPLEENLTYSFTFEGTGALTKAAVA